MRVHRHLLVVALVMGTAALGCGGGEPPKAPPAPPAAKAPPAKAPGLPPLSKASPPGTAAVWCLAQWTEGATGKFTCLPLGGTQVKVNRDSFVLQKMCINDERLTKYTYTGGQTGAIDKAEGTPPERCMPFADVKQLPETCLCEPPAGKDCSSPPSEGFKCLATGYVKLEGGA
jgi:hypothetical protein